MQVDLEGRVALVTGGTRGLGRHMSEALAANGATVVVSSRKQESCTEAAAAIAAAHGRPTAGIACHVGRWDAVDELQRSVLERFGRIDVLVNNAGMSPTYDHLTDVTEELFDKTVAVNMKGPFRLTSLVGTHMAEAGGGSIINISSTGAVRPQARFVPYAGAKAGLNAMTVGFAHAFGPTVRVNCIMPGPFATEITETWDWDRVNQRLASFALGRIGQPHEIVGAMLYLASDASSYTTGLVMSVDGGER